MWWSRGRRNGDSRMMAEEAYQTATKGKGTPMIPKRYDLISYAPSPATTALLRSKRRASAARKDVNVGKTVKKNGKNNKVLSQKTIIS